MEKFACKSKDRREFDYDINDKLSRGIADQKIWYIEAKREERVFIQEVREQVTKKIQGQFSGE